MSLLPQKHAADPAAPNTNGEAHPGCMDRMPTVRGRKGPLTHDLAQILHNVAQRKRKKSTKQ